MRTTFSGYTRRDGIIACAVAMTALFLAGMQLTLGVPYWGDDFAAYISEGIAIFEGTLVEQAVNNYILHPSPLPEEASAEGLVYVWGYPLLLSLVYGAVGFDMTAFTSVIFYKIPSLLAYGLMAGALYLYYRRRFHHFLALFLALVFSLNNNLVEQIESLYADIVFLFAFVLSLLLGDCFCDACLKDTGKGRTALLAAALGVTLWYTCQTRLNGMTAVAVVAMSHGLQLFQNRKEVSLRQLFMLGVPYVMFLTLDRIVGCFLPDATSNLSDVGKATVETVLRNLRFYPDILKHYCNTLIGGVALPLWPLMLILTAVGLYRKGLENLPLTGLLIGSFAVLILLPYTQGLRYIFNLLPILLMFAAQGGMYAWEWIRKKGWEKHGEKLLRGLALVLLVLTVAGQLKSGVSNLVRDRAPTESDVYSQDAVEMYRYIQENIPEDQVVAFCKSRALYLNTGRMSFRLGYNDHVLEDADYYLFDIFMHEPDDWETVTEKQESLRQIWSNETFLLYEVVE